MAFPVSPSDGQKCTRGNRVYQYSGVENSWSIIESADNIELNPTWRFCTAGEDIELQKYIDGVGWVTKGVFGGEASPIQPPETSDAPSIFAPETCVLTYSDPSTQQDIDGCSIADADTTWLTMDVTVTNGILDLPLGVLYEEISGGVRLTGTLAGLNNELAGLKFTPINTTEPAPQNGTISIILDDLDAGTANAEHTIIIEVLDFGR